MACDWHACEMRQSVPKQCALFTQLHQHHHLIVDFHATVNSQKLSTLKCSKLFTDATFTRPKALYSNDTSDSPAGNGLKSRLVSDNLSPLNWIFFLCISMKIWRNIMKNGKRILTFHCWDRLRLAPDGAKCRSVGSRHCLCSNTNPKAFWHLFSWHLLSAL